MISICNNSKYTKYIQWVPSDDGILISAYGSINNSNSISTNIVEINNALNVSKPIFNLSISNDLVDINIIRCPLGMSESHYIAWYLKRLYGTEYPSFDYYQYELPYSENSFLNISIKKSIKSDIFPDNIVKSEIRSLCVDIFFVNNLSTFLIWLRYHL